jgi:hypothetical protein
VTRTHRPVTRRRDLGIAAAELAGTDATLDYSVASLATVEGMLGARVLAYSAEPTEAT